MYDVYGAETSVSEKAVLSIPRPQEPKIADILDELERNLEVLNETLNMTEAKVGAVLKPDSSPQESMPGGDSKDSYTSGLNIRLRRLNSMTARAITTISSINSRVDL